MKANELRIGNLVYYLDGNGNFYQWDITVIENGITDDFEPIPLTEEWLEKFGFEKTFENPFQKHEWQFKYFTLDEKMCPYLGRYTDDTPFKYVHQLQNLYFALTGEELTIK